MSRKPRILLIPNVAWWIIGEMGKQIVARFGHKYDFYFVPEGLIERRPDLLRSFLPAVDAVHCLNESSIELFRDLDPQTQPAIATWIHHVTEWTAQHQLAAERSAALTVCTESWKEDISRRVSATLPITVVPHGVDSRVFQRRRLKPGIFGIPAKKFVVGFVGSKGSDADRGRKGTDLFLTVIRQAAAQLPHLHVVLAGPGWDAELAGLRALGISATALGYLRKAELPKLYSALDVYLMTSRVEGGPCTVFEAMACQTAVVATRTGAVPELIRDAQNGFSADVEDVATLTDAVVTLGRSPALQAEIGERARDTVKQLPWSVVLEPLEAVYDRLVAQTQEVRITQPGPTWMNHPRRLLRTSSAADALAAVIARVQRRSVTPIKATALLYDMLDRKSGLDILRGMAMLRGWTYKEPGPSTAPSPATATLTSHGAKP